MTIPLSNSYDLPAALPIPAAVRYSGLARSRIYLALNDGSLRAVKAGRRTLVLRESLDAFLAQLPAYQPQHSPRRHDER